MNRNTLNIDAEGILHLTPNSFVGRSAALLGITGSGKTNTAAVLIEELLASGSPLTIVDIEGEYWGLKERFEILVAGRSEHSELVLNPENAGALAQIAIKRGISVILDLSEYTEEESALCLMTYFQALWDEASKIKRPYQIILEEAHEWLPEGKSTPLKTLLTRIALRGRKRGLSIILMSQRSAKVAKDVLTQAALLFLHKVVHPIDMKVYKELIPLPPAEVERIIGALQPGQVVVVSDHTAHVVQIRLRSTFHAGSTPDFGENVQPELRRIDAALLHELQQKIQLSPIAQEEKPLKKRIEELEAILVEKEAEIAEKDERIALLSKLSVTMDGAVTPLTLPDCLSIEEATIGRVTVHQEASKELPSPLVAESTASDPPHLQLGTAPVIESLKRVLNKLNSRQKQVFKLLVQHSTVMDTGDIAAWLGVSRRTAQGYVPPDTLIRLGLVKQVKRSHGFAYQATLKEYLVRTLPGTSPEEISHQLFPPWIE